MRWFFLILILFAILWVGLWGWQGQASTNNPVQVFPDMDDQYKLRPQKQSDFFADGMAARKPVTGTIPMGYQLPEKAISQGGKADLRLALADDYFSTGRFGEFFGQGLPTDELTVDEAFLQRGQERYEIYCSICHGATGDGNGVVGKFWMGGMLPPTANLIDGRVAQLPEGQVFHTITHGKGLMGAYGGNIAPDDRWAIVAYVRALQISQKADANHPGVKAALDAAAQDTAAPNP